MGSRLLSWPDKLASETFPYCTPEPEATCWNVLRCTVLASSEHVVQDSHNTDEGSADDASLLAKTLRARQAFTAYMMSAATHPICGLESV